MILPYLIAGGIFVLLYLAIYRPLFSHRDPGEIGDVIAVVQNVRLQELDRLLSDEMSELMSRSVIPTKQRRAQRERRLAISARLKPIEIDVKLCLAFTEKRAMQIRGNDPASFTDREWLLQEVFDRAQSCSLVLTFAKATRFLVPWDVQRLLLFHRETVMHEVRELMVLFVRLSETYGEHHRDNLLAALDAWDLIDESV